MIRDQATAGTALILGGVLILSACAATTGAERAGLRGPQAARASEKTERGATLDRRQYYDQRRKRRYYYDPRRQGYFWENGAPKT